MFNLEVVKLVKDYTRGKVRGVVEFFLDTNSTWEYHELIEGRISFERVIFLV